MTGRPDGGDQPASGTRSPSCTPAALAWIDLAGDPVIQRIILTDAPSVLGWERWRTMGEQGAYGHTRAMLQAVADAGHLAPHSSTRSRT